MPRTATRRPAIVTSSEVGTQGSHSATLGRVQAAQESRNPYSGPLTILSRRVILSARPLVAVIVQEEDSVLANNQRRAIRRPHLPICSEHPNLTHPLRRYSVQPHQPRLNNKDLLLATPRQHLLAHHPRRLAWEQALALVTSLEAGTSLLKILEPIRPRVSTS